MPQPPALFPEDENYFALLNGLKQRILGAQLKAALAVNQELIMLYWQIGQEIVERQLSQGWGSKVIDRISKDLRREFPEMKGFSPRNLQYMRALAEAYPDEQIVLQVIAQIPWGHNQSLLNKLNSPEQRLWYARKTVQFGWSRNILDLQIDTNLFTRQGGAITNFERTLPPAQSDLSRDLLKDPYNFEFLALADEVQERDLERALVERIRDFLLELGVGFAFVGSQYRLEVDGDEYFIDLLFYHLKLHRYVVIDLKVTEFKPEYAGKMNFYISAVNHLLCDERNEATIGVATYKLREELPPALQGCLPTAEQLEMELDAVIREIGAEQDNSLL